MNEHRTAARWLAGLVLAGAAAVAGAAPAQADTGWNGTVAPSHSPTTSTTTTPTTTHVIHPADTGWNGT